MMDGTTKDGFEARFFPAADGLQLYVRDYDPGDAVTQGSVPIICLPGLSRNSRDFHAIALVLSSMQEAPRRVLSLDYRGRGMSAWDPDKSHYQLPVEANDVLTMCDRLGIGSAVVIGTSRGGLIAHLLTALRPALLRGVILNDIGPVIETAGLVHIRNYLQSQTVYRSWSEAVDGLKATHGGSFPALTGDDWRDMADAIFRQRNGEIVSDFDPALIETLKDVVADKPLPELWELFEGFRSVPLLTVRGEFSTILSMETLAEMVSRNGSMEIAHAPGQGHAPLLHIGDLPRQIAAFVSRCS